MKKKKRAASPALGCLFWAALVVVLAAIALAVREPVARNVRALFGRAEEPATASSDGGRDAEAPARTEPPASSRAAEPAATSPLSNAPAAETKPAAPAAKPTTKTPAPASASAAAPASASAAAPASASAAAPASASAAVTRTRTARLWFAKMDDDGALSLAAADRTLPVGDAPLGDSLAALLAGPTAAERGAGLVTFVPTGTAVRSVTVKGDTAIIDFSEQFRYGTLGVEGQRMQLRQVVWAATEFPTVARVQVLVEGRRVDYLGPEGVAVGSPLGRDSSFE